MQALKILGLLDSNVKWLCGVFAVIVTVVVEQFDVPFASIQEDIVENNILGL